MSASRTAGSASSVGLIATREITERLRTKSFYVLTGILVAIIVGTGVLGRVLGGDDTPAVDVGVVGDAPAGLDGALPAAAAAFDRDAHVMRYDDAAARAALDDGDVDVVVLAGQREVLFEGQVDDTVLAVVQQAWVTAGVQQRLVDAGLSPQEVAGALVSEPLTPVTLDDEGTPSGVAVLAGTMSVVLLFLAMQTFGGFVLTGVVEEKSTAVVELLLVRVRADQLLAGKVIGIGLTGLAQFAAAVVAGLISLAISGADIPGELWSTLPSLIVWFLLGYTFYSTLFALAGSLVSRQEDAQAASTPIIATMVAAYMVVFFIGFVPESTASRVLSMIPPVAPFLMPMRMAAGAASVVEVIVSIVLLVAATLGIWKLTAKIYEQVLLRRGSRIAWRDALSLARPRTMT